MKLLPIALSTLAAIAALAVPLFAGVDYINEEEQARVDRVVAPFKAGEVPPMEPSNFEAPEACQWPEEYVEWKRQDQESRRDPNGPEMYQQARTYLSVYYFNRMLNILETRDCSCAGQVVDPAHTIELTEQMPISKLLGTRSLSAKFYQRINLRTLNPIVDEFCSRAN